MAMPKNLTDSEISAWKKARNEYAKAYRETHKEQIAATLKAWRGSNKEKIAADKKLAYDANKEEILSRQKARYKSNPNAVKQKRKEYRAANPLKIKAASKAWLASNRELAAESCRAWYNSNKERAAANSKAYRENNREKIMELREAYRLANPEAASWRRATQRAWKGRKSSLEIIGLTSELAKQVWNDTRAIAVKHFPDTELHHDHMHPLAGAKSPEEGRGLNHFTNFIFIPAFENLSKHDKPFTEWFDGLTSTNLIDCVTEQIAYNDSILKTINQKIKL